MSLDGRGIDCTWAWYWLYILYSSKYYHAHKLLLKLITDACDDDKDNDKVLNSVDNCPIVFNPDQADSDKNGVGNACENDCDGDGIQDQDDVCPCNNYISRTDFRGIKAFGMGENSYGQRPPEWKFKDEGKEILQKINSAPGL